MQSPYMFFAHRGKENDQPDPMPGFHMSSALKAQPGQMGSPFVVQNNPLSNMDPSPEVGTSACQSLFAQQLADDN